MIVMGAICRKCNTFVYSRANHDYISCGCGSISLDGGQGGYGRCVGEPSLFLSHQKELDVDLTDLYRDWNYNQDVYGRELLTKQEVERWDKIDAQRRV